MPNHVKNIVTADEEVISSMLNDKGEVDFNKIVPINEDLIIEGLGISFTAERMAKSLIKNERISTSITTLSDEDFEQMVCLLRNKRKHDLYHAMDGALTLWGTKWNAYNQNILDNTDNKVKFSTAWSTPFEALKALSKKFPEERVTVIYADEDIGHNCGEYILVNGEIIYDNIADSGKMSIDDQRYWREYAFSILHPDGDPSQYGFNEDWDYVD